MLLAAAVAGVLVLGGCGTDQTAPPDPPNQDQATCTEVESAAARFAELASLETATPRGPLPLESEEDQLEFDNFNEVFDEIADEASPALATPIQQLADILSDQTSWGVALDPEDYLAQWAEVVQSCEQQGIPIGP